MPDGSIDEVSLPSVPETTGAPADPAPVAAQTGLPASAMRFRRVPHLGHAVLLGVLLVEGLFCCVLMVLAALHYHLFGISTPEQALHSAAYAAGTMGVIYLFAFLPGAAVFPVLWRRGPLAGLQWNAAAARRLWWRLMLLGAVCFGVTLGLRSMLHFPEKSPMGDLLNSPQALWVMFAFSITLAPLAEEIVCRGFLLPAFCTAVDWTGEKITGRAPRPLDLNGHPQWSLTAMIVGSAITSFLFALGHAWQNGNAAGPLLVIGSVSLVLCAVRLAARSVAASALTHATYNFSLFFVTMIGTHGFQQLHR